MNEIENIKQQLTKLEEKWVGKPEPEFMSKQDIERRVDRIKYRRLKNRYNELKAAGQKEKDFEEMVKEIFNL